MSGRIRGFGFPALGLVLGAFAGAAAAAIDAVSPGSGTVGTVLTIDGSGFGATKPKVTLADGKSGVSLPLKVTAFSDAQITAEVVPGRAKTAARQGLFEVRVAPRGGEEFVAAQGFVIEPPVVEETSPGSIAPKGALTVTGTRFGTKKGKVEIGGKKAKVTNWTDTEVSATAHKKTPAGMQDVTVSNLIGEATLADAVEVEGPGGGGDDEVRGTMEGLIAGEPYADFRPRLEGAVNASGGLTMLAGMRRGSVIYNVEVDADNLDLSTVGPLPGTTFIPLFIEVRTEDDTTTWRTAGAGSITIYKVSADRYAGVLPSITMNRTEGTGGNPTLQISSFEFDFRVYRRN